MILAQHPSFEDSTTSLIVPLQFEVYKCSPTQAVNMSLESLATKDNTELNKTVFHLLHVNGVLHSAYQDQNKFSKPNIDQKINKIKKCFCSELIYFQDQ